MSESNQHARSSYRIETEVASQDTGGQTPRRLAGAFRRRRSPQAKHQGYPMNEETLRQIHALEQFTGALRQIAHATAAYYRSLIEEGAPLEVATMLTLDYQRILLTSGKRESQ